MCCSTTPSTGQIGNECRQTKGWRGGERERELTAEESERERKERLEGKRKGKGKEKKGKEKKPRLYISSNPIPHSTERN